ncbi:MAG: DUF192 domain-containing protein [Oscillatoriaceae cyanobacterium Prado104]|jgi:hypothetical protein|nr:DUF192 domain-containing protein [Oscillatoriaceae cyanobacterium Prado104]
MANIEGTFSFDFLLGTANADRLRGLAGNDTIQGIAGNDLLFGDRDSDLLSGNEGADSIAGGQGSDTIYGGIGDDWMSGDRGQDLLIGGEGKDILTGGAGDDLLIVDRNSAAASAAEADLITDFGSGNDKLVLVEGMKFDDLEISIAGDRTVLRERVTGKYLAALSGVNNLDRSNFISLFGGVDSAQLLPVSVNVIMGNSPIGLEVARSSQEQALGLMFRTEIPDDRGMYFPIEPARNVRFWMKNVFVELDMIFLRQGVVQAIIPNVPPCFSDNCPNYGPDVLVDGVIEIRGGRAAELSLKAGDRIPNLP